jgi:putative ATP-binding cassette transporter
MPAGSGSQAAAGEPDRSGHRRPPSYVGRKFLRMARGFWSGETKREAWLLTGGVLVFVILNLAAALGVNRWNRYFFDALDKKEVERVWLGVGLILALAVFSAASQVGLVHMRMRLQLRWRQWLTRHLIRRWLSERRFYQLTIVTGEGSNPEFRIADDARLAIEPLVEFVNGLLNAILAALAFIGVLWAVGGGIQFEAFGTAFSIPGYMVLAAVVYSAVTSIAMLTIGRPLIDRVEQKNAGEARLRYELTRVRDSAENIALIGGDDEERARLYETFADLAKRWLGVIKQQARMTWVVNGNTVLSPVVPLLLGAPKYLSGSMSLGELMQVATAFVSVQIALNWLVDNAIRLAEWLASAQRVLELTDVLDMLDRTIGRGAPDETIVLGESPDESLHIEGLSIMQLNGSLMVEGADASVPPGEKILVKGDSGTGKSTLIRAMAGLWPWGSGKILRPADASIAFMPQRPYIPLGTFRHAVLYPSGPPDTPDDVIADALTRCGLKHLIPRLDEEENWDGVLSGGEKQRLAFARLLVAPPDIVIMDEATSALDEASQASMMEFFRSDLQQSTVLHVAHRPGLEEYHDREIRLVRVDAGHAVAQDRRYPRMLQVWQQLLRPRARRNARNQPPSRPDESMSAPPPASIAAEPAPVTDPGPTSGGAAPGQPDPPAKRTQSPVSEP